MKGLELGTYKIPEGCVCKVEKGKITIRESKAKKIEGDRCRNCKHCAMGHSINNSFWQTTICMKKPRSTKHLRPGLTAVYYHVSPTGKVCELFEKKEQ